MAEELEIVVINSHEYRDLVEESCMNYRRGQVISLIGDTIRRNFDPDKNSINSRYAKYGRACQDPHTVIDCILTILEITDPWTFRQIMNDWPEDAVHMEEDLVPEDEEDD